MSLLAERIPDRRQRQAAIGALLVAAILAAIAALSSRASDWRPLDLLVTLAVVNTISELLASRHSQPGHGSWAVSLSAPVILTMTLLGPAPALAIGWLGLLLCDTRDHLSLTDRAANLANYAIFSVFGALAARWAVDTWSLVPDEAGFVVLILAITVWVEAASFAVTAIHAKVAYGDSIGDQWKSEGNVTLGSALPAMLFTAVTAYIYGAVGLGALGLLAVVQLLHQYLAHSLSVSQYRAEELQAQAERLAELSASRGRLVGQVLQAEETERRRLAEALHDEALQDLLSARHGLDSGSETGTDRARKSIGRAIAQLRGAIFDLHPAVLEHAGLAAALHEVADNQAQRAGFQAKVEVAPGACGHHDTLLFVLGREQLTNAAKHAGASHVELMIGRENGVVVMQITDDGRGIDSERLGAAVEQGHIGLASSAERVEALGGELRIEPRPGGGTRIRTTLPVN